MKFNINFTHSCIFLLIMDLYNNVLFLKCRIMCEKNKISRSQNVIIYIPGSKSFQQQKEEEKRFAYTNFKTFGSCLFLFFLFFLRKKIVAYLLMMLAICFLNDRRRRLEKNLVEFNCLRSHMWDLMDKR